MLPLAFTVFAAGAWFALAAWHPTTTWHLAPALVAGAGAWVTALGASRQEVQGRRLVGASAALGLVVALGELAALNALGWLEGPTLFGQNAVIESTLTAALGASSAVVASLRDAPRPKSVATESGPMRD